MIKLSIILLPVSLFGAFTFTQSPVSTNITHTGARILSATSALTFTYVVWDTSTHASCTPESIPSIPCPEYPKSDTSGSVHGVFNWFIGGITASTPVFFRVCSTDSSAYTCTAEQTFTTLAAPTVHPAKAVRPVSAPNPSVPTQSGTTRTIGVTSGCFDLYSCWNISSCDDTIVIRASVPMIGNWPLPPKVCTAGHQLLIVTDQVSKLPPVGVRPDNTYIPFTASVEPSNFFHYLPTTVPVNNNCFPGAYMWVTPVGWYAINNDPGFTMQQCVANNTPKNITNITGCVGAGNGNIGTCSVTTSTNHGFSAQDIIHVKDVVGITRVNGTCRVTSITSSTVFVMTCTAAYVDLVNNAYISGGTADGRHWQAVTAQSITLGPAPTYFPPSGSCSPEGAWGYDSSVATQNANPSYGPFLGPTQADGITSAGSVVRCMKNELGTALVWRRWTVQLGDPTNAPSANYTIDLSGSSYIYLLGIRLASQKIPPEPLFLEAGGPPESVQAFQGGKESSSFLLTSTASSNITIDRCIIDGIGYPNGMSAGALQLHGDNISVIDSYITGLGQWFGAADRGSSLDNYAGAAIIRSNGTGFLFRNNYVEAYGLSIHFDESKSAVLLDQDITTVQNTFYRNPTHFYGSPENLAAYPITGNIITGDGGVYWPGRQIWECKWCLRALNSGNQYINNWKSVSGGAGIQMSPRMESSPFLQAYATASGGNTIDWSNIPVTNLAIGDWLACTATIDQLYQVTGTPTTHSVTVASIANGPQLCALANTPYGITDITIENNTFSNLSNVVNTFGMLTTDTTPIVRNVLVAPLQRIIFNNNLYMNILDDGTKSDPGLWQTNGGGDVFVNPHPFGFDIIFNHETVYSVAGTNPNIFGAVGTGYLKNSEGISMTNNIGIMKDPATCLVPINCRLSSPITAGGLSGTAMMDATTINYTLGNTLYWMAGGNPGGYPGSITWPASIAAVKFFNTTDNFRLRHDSPAVSGAATKLSTDGLDLGANIDQLEAAQGKVSNVHDFSVTNTTASIGFLAPNTTACGVDWGTDSTFVTYTRQSGSGGARVQIVNLSGLVTNTLYYYRVNCSIPISGVFRTH